MTTKEPPKCYTCHEEVTFDNNRRGKNGKMIPLDPKTNQPHQCRESVMEEHKQLGEGPKIFRSDHQEVGEAGSERITIKPKFAQHRIRLVAAEELGSLQDAVNAILAENDSNGYSHRGVTILTEAAHYIACIHYEIPAEAQK